MKTEKLFDAMDLISQDYKKEALETMKNKNADKRTIRIPNR